MRHTLLYIIGLALLLTACDSGDIVERTYNVTNATRTLYVTGQFLGLDEWPAGYSIVVSGFEDGQQYATVQRALTTDAEGHASLSVPLSERITNVELCVANRLRERILTLQSLPLPAAGSTTVDVGTIDVGLLGALQEGVFNQACIQCHGQNGRKAAGLDLTDGNAAVSLVGVASSRKEGRVRVVPGDADASLLHDVLNEGGEHILSYNHVEVLSSHFKEQLAHVRSIIDLWIGQVE